MSKRQTRLFAIASKAIAALALLTLTIEWRKACSGLHAWIGLFPITAR